MMAQPGEEAAKRLMRREQFPAVLFDEGGKPHQNYCMIPPLHTSIVKGGFDLNSVLSVMNESLQESYFDMKEAEQSGLAFNIRPDDVERFADRWQRNCEVSKDSLGLRGFPYWNFLMVEKDMITTREKDHCFCIDPSGGIQRLYMIPRKFLLSEELSDEYEFQHGTTGRNYDEFCCERTGWYTHDAVAPLSIFFKNIVIGANNVVVAAKYDT
jgi:hypothetical protein